MDEAGPGLFPLGRRIVSRNTLAVLGEARAEPNRLFDRHAAGDWGVIEDKSWYLNRMGPLTPATGASPAPTWCWGTYEWWS